MIGERRKEEQCLGARRAVLNQYKWHALEVADGFYAARHKDGKTVLMHREIMQPPPGMVVDHIDGNRANRA